MREHQIHTRVRYGETDQMGVVYHGNYAQFFEMGRVEWLRNMGISYKFMEENGIMLPVVSLTMNYKKPARYDDLLTIKTIFKNLLGIAAFTMVIVWMSICLSQFNFRRQWYKDGHTAKELGFAAPLFPIVPILGFVFCFITGISMATDPEMLPGFIGCLIFIAGCYLSYYIFYRKQN